MKFVEDLWSMADQDNPYKVRGKLAIFDASTMKRVAWCLVTFLDFIENRYHI
jgi:hypothetical protein